MGHIARLTELDDFVFGRDNPSSLHIPVGALTFNAQSCEANVEKLGKHKFVSDLLPREGGGKNRYG